MEQMPGSRESRWPDAVGASQTPHLNGGLGHAPLRDPDTVRAQLNDFIVLVQGRRPHCNHDELGIRARFLTCTTRLRRTSFAFIGTPHSNSSTPRPCVPPSTWSLPVAISFMVRAETNRWPNMCCSAKESMSKVPVPPKAGTMPWIASSETSRGPALYTCSTARSLYVSIRTPVARMG